VTPICGLFAQVLPPAAKTMGVKLRVVKAGASADSVQGAMNTIVGNKPTGVVLPAVEPDIINNQLRTLQGDKVPVVSNGIMNHQKYGIDSAMFNTETAVRAGSLIADWVVAHKGAKANVAFELTPELSFGRYIKDAFAAEMKKRCASCKVRYVTVPVGTIGNTAPNRVVSDLQSHPDTNVVAFSTLEAAVGLPTAMRTAGIKTDVTGFGPNPANLQDMKNGGITSGIGLDLPVMLWTQMDAAARLATGQPLTKGEQGGIPPIQLLEQKDITFDPSRGWTGYPDFAQRFQKLWNPTGSSS
jgi:ribose transport system substrate-binding protein